MAANTDQAHPEIDNPDRVNAEIPQPQAPPIHPAHLHNPALNAAIQIINPSNHALTICLTDTNYLLWRLQVLISARGYEIDGFLSGAISRPTETLPEINGLPGPVNPEFIIWQRQDQLFAAWLLASMNEDILVNLVGLNTSREIWDSLERNFASQSKAKIMQYKLQLQTLKKGILTMREYISKMKNCVDLLAAAGHTLSEEDQVLHLLSGLGHEYDPLIVPITTRSEPYSLNDVWYHLLSFESRLDTTNPINSDGTSLSANLATHHPNQTSNTSQPRNFSSNNTNSYNRGRGGRGGRGGRRRGNFQPKNSLQCQLCGKSGHTVLKCYYRFDVSFQGFSGGQSSHSQGFSGGQSSHSDNTSKPGNSSAMTASLTPVENISDSNRYPDSGATHHVTNDFSNLNIGSEYHGASQLVIGNGAGLCHGGNSSSRES